jgi:hypothetical protein
VSLKFELAAALARADVMSVAVEGDEVKASAFDLSVTEETSASRKIALSMGVLAANSYTPVVCSKDIVGKTILSPLFSPFLPPGTGTKTSDRIGVPIKNLK